MLENRVIISKVKKSTIVKAVRINLFKENYVGM